MNESILFLGKFDENLLLLEEQVLSLQKNQNLNQIKKSEFPDVIKYKINGYQTDAWVIIGDVKPTLLLKNLISETKIIIFVFNLKDSESLAYLLEGWLPIIEKADKNKTIGQQRILIGTNSGPDINRDIILEYFHETMKKLGCNQYYEDGPNIDSTLPKKMGQYSISTDLFNYLKSQFTKDDAKDEEIYEKNSYVFYRLSKSNRTAKVIESPKAFGKITIPSTLEFKGYEYTITDVCDNAFKNSQIIALSFLPDSKLSRIGDFAFENSSLKELFLPASLVELGKYWCGRASKLIHVEIDKKNKHFGIMGSILYHINQIPNEKSNPIKYELLFVPRDYSRELIIPSNVSRIGSFAFYNCFGIKKIVYKTNMIDIDDYSFSCLSRLSCVEFECNELFSGNFSFASCESLSSIYFQNLTNANIGMSAFDGCISLKEISLNSLYNINIESYCFNEVIKLQKINLFCSDNLTLGDFCFKKCSSLSTVSFQCPKNVPKKSEIIKNIKICDNCFEDCTSLSKFTCENVENITINKNSFKGCLKMKEINIKSTKSIELNDNCFSEMKCLYNLFIKSNELLIKGHLFDKKQCLSSINITTNLSLTITKETFDKCSNLTSIVISSNCTLTILKNNFLQLAYLETLELYGNTIIIEDNCFNKCVNIFIENYSKNIFKIFKIKSSSLIEIGKNCFNELLYLNSIEITGQKVVIYNSCFNRCISLSHCIFSGSSKIFIGNLCFNECNNISTISLSNFDYIEIDSESFIDCTNKFSEFNINPSKSINPNDYFYSFQNFGEKILQTYSVQLDEKSDQFSIDVYLNDTREFQISFFKRMILLSRLNYLGIIPLIGFGFITVNQKCYPVIMRKNSLESLIAKKDPLTNSQKYIILLGIIYGIKCLHALKIYLTNLELNNIFLDANFYPCIFDYGIFFNLKTNTSILAIDSSKKNIFLYSKIFYELITGKSLNLSDINANLNNISNPKIKELLRRIWLFDSYFVPPADDIFEFIKNIEFKKLFSTNDEQISQYLDLIEKSDISELHLNNYKMIEENIIKNNDGIIYRLLENKTAEIISYNNNKCDIFIPKYIKYGSIKYEIRKICKKAFVNSPIMSISFSLNSSLSIIDSFAFSNSAIQKLFIPASLIELGKYWSAYTNFTQIEIDENNSHFFKEKDIIYYTNGSHDKSELMNEIVFVPHNMQNQISIPSISTRIGSFAFQKCDLILIITIETDSIILDSCSFHKCEKLSDISLIQKELLLISNSSFNKLKQLKSLGIKSQFLTVEQGWIKDCPSLEMIVLDISNGLQLTPYFFDQINSLYSIIIISQSSLSFMTDSFYCLPKLTEIEFKALSFSFDNLWINNCPNLQKISIESDNNLTVTPITLSQCKSLNSIKIISSSKIIFFDECFSNSTSIQEVILSSKDVTIGNICFKECNELSSIKFLNIQNLKIGSYSFQGYLNFTDIHIVALNEIDLGDYCFSGSYNLQKVAFNCKELKLGNKCFMNCCYLRSLSFENLQNAKIQSHAFSGCNSLTQFNISVSSKLILCNNCFYGASKLISASFASNTIMIGDYIFNYCNKLNNVKILSHKKYISKYAYYTTYEIRFNVYYD